jgi:membrane-associated phospholipid phosphatase
VHRDDCRRSRAIVVGFAVLGCLLLPLDMPLARTFVNDVTPDELRAIFHRAEVFGHFYGLVAICVTIWLLDARNRRFVPTIFMAAAGAGLVADLLKMVVWRVRPCRCELQRTVWETFSGHLFSEPWWEGHQMFSSTQHSLPSAHAAMAAALAVALTRSYPAGRVWFWTLAFLVGMNRVDGGAHFASDVCWGTALGYGFAGALLRSSRLEAVVKKLVTRMGISDGDEALGLELRFPTRQIATDRELDSARSPLVGKKVIATKCGGFRETL